MMQTVTSVPPHGTHVYINNRFRDVNAVSAYSFKVPQFGYVDSNVRSYLAVVKSVVTQNFIQTITASQNDAVQWRINGILYENVFSPGYYSINSLINSLNTAIQSVNVGFVFAYDTISHRMSLTVPATFSFAFVRPSVFSTTYVYDRKDFKSRHDRFLNMIGFFENGVNTVQGLTTVVGSDPVNISCTNWMDINIDFNINVMHTNPNNPQTITSVPVDVDYGQTIVFEPPTPRTFIIPPSSLEYVYIYVTDEWGNAVVVPENTPLQIHLLLIPLSG